MEFEDFKLKKEIETTLRTWERAAEDGRVEALAGLSIPKHSCRRANMEWGWIKHLVWIQESTLAGWGDSLWKEQT